MCIELIIEISKALLTPLIAIIAAYVAWQQLKTNRRKLKLDLFDRRYVVVEKIGEFIGSIVTSGTVREGKETQFLVDTKSVTYLFYAEISDFVSEAHRQAVALHALEAQFTGLTGNDRASNLESQKEIKEWFIKSLTGLPTLFSRYLKLEH